MVIRVMQFITLRPGPAVPRLASSGDLRFWPNAGRDLGDGFLDQDPEASRNAVETNITGTLDLSQRVAREQ